MTQTNHERVGRALDILREGLKPFIKQKMQAVYGERWLQTANASLRDHHLTSTPAGELSGDIQALLQVLWDQQGVFSFENEVRSWIKELLLIRNNWAHHRKEFNTDDVYRALDSIQRLLTAISARSFASEIKRRKDELLHILIEEQSHQGTSDREAEIRLLTEIQWQDEQLKLNEQLKTFTDRREALTLFDLITTHDSGQLSHHFPMLAFVAYGGSGKSTLINFLRAKRCYSTNGKVLLPYAHLNFTDLPLLLHYQFRETLVSLL